MSYHFTIGEKPSYLHAKVTGTRTAENARRFLVEAHAACVRRNFSALLLEMNLSGPSLNPSSIFDVISERSPDGLKFEKIAYIDAGSEGDPQQAKFAETVAVNRGVMVRLFRNLDDAECWTRGSAQEDHGKGSENEA
jgi:hypothetical protein